MAKKIQMPYSAAGILTPGADVKSGGIEISPLSLIIAVFLFVLVVKFAHLAL